MPLIEIRIGQSNGEGISGRSIARVVFGGLFALLGLYLAKVGLVGPVGTSTEAVGDLLLGAWNIFFGISLMLGKRWTYRGGNIVAVLLLLSGGLALYQGQTDAGVASLILGFAELAVLRYTRSTFYDDPAGSTHASKLTDEQAARSYSEAISKYGR